MTNQEQYSRTRMLLGDEGVARLRAARVAVFGIGGVGGHVVEALARSGIGALDLIDDDKVCPSNLNRQLIALHSTLGQHKVDAARDRIERAFNCKFPQEYMQRPEKIAENQRAFRAFYEQMG